MRVIKFRVPCKCQNGHFRWAYVGFRAEKQDIQESILSWGPRTCNCPVAEIGEGFAPVGGKQQFIGLADKNGKEIYEGDIVQKNDDVIPEHNSAFGRVYWHGNEAGFYIHLLKGGECSFYYPDGSNFNFKDLEVIGNIYESPELMEKT